MFWCRLLPEGKVLAGDMLAWAVIHEVSELLHIPKCTASAGDVAREARTQFPLAPAHVYAPTLDELMAEAFLGNLHVLNGLAATWGEHFALYQF